MHQGSDAGAISFNCSMVVDLIIVVKLVIDLFILEKFNMSEYIPLNILTLSKFRV